MGTGRSNLTSVASHDRDRLDLDEPVRMRERADLDKRRGAALLPEKLLANRRPLRAMAHVGHVRRDLHHVRQRPALRLDERLDRVERAARLSGEVAAERGTTVLLVRHLTGEKKNRLRAGHLHALAVGGRIEQARRAELLELRSHRPLPASKTRPRSARGCVREPSALLLPDSAAATTSRSTRRARARSPSLRPPRD